MTGYEQNHKQYNDDLPSDILSIFSPEMAEAIREQTHNALARDLNMTPYALQHMLHNPRIRKENMGLRFFSKRLRQLA